MSAEGREFSGRSVDEAVAAGLQTLGLRSNQVRVDVISKGSRGLFGIGSEPAVVRLIPIQQQTNLETTTQPVNLAQTNHIEELPSLNSEPESVIEDARIEQSSHQSPTHAQVIDNTEDKTPETTPDFAASKPKTDEVNGTDNADEAFSESETEAASVEMLSKMVSLLGFKATVEPVWKDGDDEHDDRVLWLEIHGRDLSALIGRRGETLENIQYLLRMMVNQRLRRWNDIVVDVDQYRVRRAEQISQLAQRMATQAVSAGRAMALEPMPPNERRIVHMALRDHPHVYTQSSGDGERRKVYIVPKS